MGSDLNSGSIQNMLGTAISRRGMMALLVGGAGLQLVRPTAAAQPETVTIDTEGELLPGG